MPLGFNFYDRLDELPNHHHRTKWSYRCGSFNRATTENLKRCKIKVLRVRQL